MVIGATGWGMTRSRPSRDKRLRLVPADAVAEPASGPVAADVLAALGHELRAPLASLRATLELLTEESATDSLVARLESGLGWLEGLVDNLGTWALLEAGRLPVSPRAVGAESVAERALSLVAPLLERKGQRVELICPRPGLMVDADPQYLGQILINLLTNSVRYSPAGGLIQLSITAVGSVVELRVTDEGPGIPRRERARIFSPYARGARARRAGGPGLGLGLHIVRTLVAMHEGTVGVDSEPGHGASFWVRLPGAATCSVHKRGPAAGRAAS
jgi:signal transduction histidine kinase